MAAAYFEIGYEKVIIEGKPSEMIRKLEAIQDFDCLVFMGKQYETSKKGKAEIGKLEGFLDKWYSGELSYDDIRKLKIDLSIGGLECTELLEEEDAVKTLSDKYPNARLLK